MKNKTKLTIAAELIIPSEKFQEVFGQTKKHDRFYSSTSWKTTLSLLQINKILNDLDIDIKKILYSETLVDSTDSESEERSEAIKCEVNVVIKE